MLERVSPVKHKSQFVLSWTRHPIKGAIGCQRHLGDWLNAQTHPQPRSRCRRENAVLCVEHSPFVPDIVSPLGNRAVSRAALFIAVREAKMSETMIEINSHLFGLGSRLDRIEEESKRIGWGVNAGNKRLGWLVLISGLIFVLLLVDVIHHW
jgi:hypothetical protein